MFKQYKQETGFVKHFFEQKFQIREAPTSARNSAFSFPTTFHSGCESRPTTTGILGQEALAAHTVQAALDGSREKNLIWRSARGAYALEDESLAQWFNQGRGNR